MAPDSFHSIAAQPVGAWEKHLMALDDVNDRLQRFTGALSEASVPYALVGGQAVAIWVATKDPDAVRTTKNVDVLLDRDNLPAARAACRGIDMDYFEVMGVGMFLEQSDPNPRRGVHLVWAGEKVRADYALPSPQMEECETVDPGLPVVDVRSLVTMKLMANRDQDCVHLRDMIDVGLVERGFLDELPSELAERLDSLLADAGR